MGKLLKAIFGFFTSLIPFIETLFLSFVIGRYLHSTSLSIVIFIALIFTSFIWHSLFKAIAWAVMVYLMVTVSQSSGVVFAVILAVVVGGIRFVLEKIIRR
ncbi:hypothetical protein [Thermoactinomyces mirandus]|uniref:Uncharacterized protein n=1 Tax=Thermoactinomyces mirandus TaxID=2756294 RepID=A0A7W1XUZ8_9BACL|nr:hypothetical protein [Thermoactinomyces mirandus]MBA4603783.1 hypothetical protein [Thermoactinomyces mirandus]